MKKTIENLVTGAILQTGKEITIGGRTYTAASPTAGTLIEISSLVSQMPPVNASTDDEISETLSVARDCNVIFDIVATLILGVKKRMTIGWFIRKVRFNRVRNQLKYNASPQELNDVVMDLLVNHSEVQVFFSLITSLSAINLLKPTKSVTTASGRQ